LITSVTNHKKEFNCYGLTPADSMLRLQKPDEHVYYIGLFDHVIAYYCTGNKKICYFCFATLQ